MTATKNTKAEGVPISKSTKNAGATRDEIIAWTVNRTRSASHESEAVPAPSFAWMDRWFDRPCTIASALNEI